MNYKIKLQKNHRPLVFLFSIWVVLFCSCSSHDQPLLGAEETFTSAEGRKIPYYHYENFEADYLNKRKDSTYVFNFWATWCAPCVAELPYFLAAARNLQEEKIKFIFVSLDFKKDLEKRLGSFLDKQQFNQEVLVMHQKDAADWIPKINKDWDGSIPATLFIKGNKQHFVRQSFHSSKEIEAAIKEVHSK